MASICNPIHLPSMVTMAIMLQKVRIVNYWLHLITVSSNSITCSITVSNVSYIIKCSFRTPSQVLALIHYIHEAVPLTIVITTPNHIITAKDEKLSKYNEDALDITQKLYNYQDYATSILNRTKLVLNYLDSSMMKMSESKNALVQNKIGSEIDLFAGGEASYLEFKRKMREEAANGVKKLNNDVETDHKPDDMWVDLS